MLDEIGSDTISIITGILGIAVLAVIVSKKSNAPGVIQAFGSALGNDINAAVSPVTNAAASVSQAATPALPTLATPSLGSGMVSNINLFGSPFL